MYKEYILNIRRNTQRAYNRLGILKSLSLLLILFISCDDKIKWEDNGEYPTDTETQGMYILCEGLFNMNNSTLSYYDFTEGKMVNDFFEIQNGRKLGDTGNDMQKYGSKIWCAVNVSSQLEVIDVNTGKSLKQIPLFNEEGKGRQPRKFAFYGDKAYVCNFDGTVARIDTTTLALETLTTVGRNPDGICHANGKLYVSNSGGLDEANPDNTVSVIDIKNFQEIKKIPVRDNPGAILSDATGNIYLVTRDKFNYALNDYDCQLHRIDSETDEVIQTYNLPILNFTISGYKAYLYSYDSQKETIRVLDTRTGQITDEDFIKESFDFTRIYNITVNPINEDVYICDAHNYVINGSIYCFTKEGKHKFTLDAKGINPNSIVFTAVFIEDNGNEPGGNGEFTNSINQVYEYVPAPGQFVNQLPAYAEGDTEEIMLTKCLDRLKQNYLIALGGYGGYITVGFEAPLINTPGEFDFRILGNAFDGSAEPGIVLVSKDINGDGLPNDPWYEIKGSEYNNPKTIRNYEITYYKPEIEDDRVFWTDNQGNNGYVERSIHKQSYYPSWITDKQITFKGTRLPNNAVYDNSLGKWVMSSFEYGYADNHSDYSEGSKFKIDWAVDEAGNSVELDQIDFIKIYTGVNQSIAGGVGEVSTEFRGIVDLSRENK